jgi:hypothetical protein
MRARVERQVVEVEQQVMATQRRMETLAANQRQAA